MQRLFKEMLILGITAIAGLYLINPTAGVFELIPDLIPIVGNIDEASASLIVLATLRYYGLDLTRLFGRGQKELVRGKGEWNPSAYPSQGQQTGQYQQPYQGQYQQPPYGTPYQQPPQVIVQPEDEPGQTRHR